MLSVSAPTHRFGQHPRGQSLRPTRSLNQPQFGRLDWLKNTAYPNNRPGAIITVALAILSGALHLVPRANVPQQLEDQLATAQEKTHDAADGKLAELAPTLVKQERNHSILELIEIAKNRIGHLPKKVQEQHIRDLLGELTPDQKETLNTIAGKVKNAVLTNGTSDDITLPADVASLYEEVMTKVVYPALESNNDLKLTDDEKERHNRAFYYYFKRGGLENDQWNATKWNLILWASIIALLGHGAVGHGGRWVYNRRTKGEESE